MEFQFSKTVLDCMKTAAWDMKNEELVQEVRLPDGMEDMSRVLGTWGQILIRSKEWRPEGMSITGGVTAWVMYTGENSNSPNWIEVWMPYQLRWPFMESKSDGKICVSCSIQSMDARMVSSRKIILRCVISVAGQGLEHSSVEVFAPAELPQDVQLLQTTYPVTLVKEAGEKPFALEEELHLPGECADCERLVWCSIQPEIMDKKIMADKAVFRGSVLVKMLCSCVDGRLHSCDFEIPFSQYAELDGEYGANARMWISPVVTNMEPELGGDGCLRLKAGLIGQYIIYDTHEISVVEDAYSPERLVQPQLQMLNCEALLDMSQQIAKKEQMIDFDGAEIIDVSCFCGQPTVYSDNGDIEMTGSVQVLGMDSDGHMQADNGPWKHNHTILSDSSCKMMVCTQPTGKTQISFGPEGDSAKQDIMLDVRCTAMSAIQMVVGMTAEEAAEKNPARPNLILRKAGDQSLWEMAKTCGSTMDKIRQANGFTGEPDPETVLMIPVL